jgi:uncharacterized protein (TIGR01244 family)
MINIPLELTMKRALLTLALVVISVSFIAAQSQVKKQTVPGITNFAQVETTVACAGAVTPAAVAEIKKMGFKAIFNLRLATEQGADVEAETAAAKVAGISFFHMPLSGTSPDPAVVDNFLRAIAAPGNQPALIHCASGNRASALWFIKRVIVDKWDTDRALSEANELGAISPTMKTFALNYIDTHKK